MDARAQERLRNRLKAALFLRVLLVSGFLGALALSFFRNQSEGYAVSTVLLLWGIALAYAVTLISAVVLLRVRQLGAFAYGQLLFDVLLVTGVVYVTGSTESPFGFLYSLVVIAAAFLVSSAGAVAMAAVSSIAYAALVGAVQLGLLYNLQARGVTTHVDLDFIVRFAITNASFFVIALLASSLTRRLQAAESLLLEREAERERLISLQEALARNIDSALVTTDLAGQVTSANPVAGELIGRAPAELIGCDLGSLFPPLRHTSSGRLSFLQSPESNPTEFRFLRDGDGERILRCSAALLRDTYQNPIGALFIFQDITGLRRLEEKLKQSAEDLIEAHMEADDGASGDGLVGTSPPMQRVREFIDKVARSDATVLLSGESGTGKELVARAIHSRSPRAGRPFVAVNCGAIPENLIESELFGHAKGAFTGAVQARAGLFRSADGGTVFLDEIGELPLPLQVKLLRVLQERTFNPVGSDAAVSVDVRIIAATNRSLEAEVAAGRFREDLYYRLNVLALSLPPLRERRQDIPLLVRRFLRQFSELHGKNVHRLSVAAAKRLQDYHYPGNIRELENIIEHAVALCDGETVHEEHLPEYLLRLQGGEPAPLADTPGIASATPLHANSAPSRLELVNGNLDDSLAAYEKSIILRALAEAGGVKKRAADLLGINYRSFRHRLYKYGLNDINDRFGLDDSETTHSASG
ncbi:MAG: sigma 54-interacting transcriptional regulator [Candidatus Binatia bacterium]|nr:sigma 54-interacting transcriptional regulator [Candidatus Binatia bacterium]